MHFFFLSALSQLAPGLCASVTMQFNGYLSDREGRLFHWVEGTTCNLVRWKPLTLRSSCSKLALCLVLTLCFVLILPCHILHSNASQGAELSFIDHHFDMCHRRLSCELQLQPKISCSPFLFQAVNQLVFCLSDSYFPLFDRDPLVRDFDSSLGFPGEGPCSSNLWTLSSSNIGSLKTNLGWKHSVDNVQCLQETRIGCNNIRVSRKAVEETGLALHMCAPLKGMFRTDGQHTTMHGGTAILAAPELSFPFDFLEDHTGLYKQLFDNHRANACWIQVTPSQKALVFSVYAKTAASAVSEVFDYNDSVFADLLTICSQFGEIPIIIAGDFQSNPLHYPSLSHAVNFHGWFDPLSQSDSSGEVFRPMTYSKDSSFSGFGDFCSSIDGILLNTVAHSALRSIEVLAVTGVQHRPIRASFSWSSIRLHGFTQCKFAPLEVNHLSKPGIDVHHPSNVIASNLWDDSVASCFEQATEPENKWDIINKFCLDTLVQSGATWGPGPRCRGQAPILVAKQFCPGQAKTRSALTLRGSWFQNTLARLWELSTRLQRPISSVADEHILTRTALKAWKTLHVLKSPFVWLIPKTPNLVDIQQNIQWIQFQLQAWDFRKRQQRIQAWKSKVKASAVGDRKYIFHHLKSKVADEPSNLVLDANRNIVCQPNEALALINSQWDDIFASNMSHDDPISILQVAWPYIQKDCVPWQTPPLTGADLAVTIAARKPEAAAGLDGWRTTDLQFLPLCCLNAIATFFSRLEDSCGADIPSVLVRAKQIILNKAGPSSPLNKRLITIFSPMLLAYTGTRFRHLQEWQMATMHASLYGGIRHRSMASVSTGLRLDMDVAQSTSQPLVGIKLDQSKCFDRIIPNVAGTFMLALGVPKGIVNTFLMMYRGLTKHLSYRGWMSKTHTTIANGVAQGCSMSLVAINVYMHVWACFVENIPHVTSRVFIDDAYLWVRLIHIHHLQTALQVTIVWGDLVGQQLNTGKSVLWATSALARKQAKSAFPALPLCLEFDVLGAKIYTSNRDAFIFDANKTSKVVADIRNISNLPVPRVVKGQLLGAKVLPQLSFAAHISKIPKQAIDKIRGELVQVFWDKRPHWRSRMLVFALLSPPHRVEPVCARAYCCILDFWRFIHSHPERSHQCVELLSQSALPKHALLNQVQEALSVFHLFLSAQLELGFGDVRIPVLHIGVHDLKPLLQNLAIQYCYEQAGKQSRKDLSKPQGFLDISLFRTFYHLYPRPYDKSLDLTCHFDSQSVGCTITNDRRCAAGYCDTNACRFCGLPSESMLHLITECQGPLPIQEPPAHDFGPNFRLLGLFDHPTAIAQHRLEYKPVPPPQHNFDPQAPVTKVWTDGSVFFSANFWLTAAGYSVISQTGLCLEADRVHSVKLSSYAAELFALLRAFQRSNSAVHVHTDCKTIVDQFRVMCRSNCIPPSWSHRFWWDSILRTYRARSECHDQPLQVTWIPAHLGDNFPSTELTEEFAIRHGTTLESIRLNRVADIYAKQVAMKAAAVHPEDFHMLQQAVYQRQLYLARWNFHIGNVLFHPEHEPEESQPQLSPLEAMKKRFPKWDWEQPASSFTWTTTASLDCSAGWFTKLQPEDIATFFRFMHSLQWRVEDSVKTAYVEISFLFWKRGYFLHDISAGGHTFRDLVFWIRRMLVFVQKRPNHQIFPGKACNFTLKTEGRALPQGAIIGAIPRFSIDELVDFGELLCGGCTRSLTSWEFPI